MNIRIKLYITILITFLYALTSFSQTTYEAGILPTLSLSKKFEKGYNLSFLIGSRDAFISGAFQGTPQYSYEHILTDMAIISSKKVGINNKIAFGYQFRIRDKRIFHRWIQQFTIINTQIDGLRMAHRIAADETYVDGDPLTVRFRYRLTTEIPLNGVSADPKEWYFKLNHEYLNAFQSNEYDLEIRLVPLFGYKFSDTNKLETGIDYRINSFIDSAAKHRLWLSLNWYLKI